MTDSSLDDFFAKKDKSKKSKTKGKYTTSEEITKKFEISQRQSSSNEPTSTGNNTQSSTNVTNTGAQDDEEWNEVELEKEKDYSGLRIQALSIADREKEEELAKEHQPQENGEDKKVLETNIGPWKMSSGGGASSVVESETPEKVEETPVEPEEEEEEEEPEEKPTKAVYRPPAMRYSSQPGSGGGGGPGSGMRRHGRNVPEMDSELHFPSLSQAVDSPKGSSKSSEKSFQSVKHGSRSKDDSLHQGVQLDLGNKYSALGSN